MLVVRSEVMVTVALAFGVVASGVMAQDAYDVSVDNTVHDHATVALKPFSAVRFIVTVAGIVLVTVAVVAVDDKLKSAGVAGAPHAVARAAASIDPRPVARS